MTSKALTKTYTLVHKIKAKYREDIHKSGKLM